MPKQLLQNLQNLGEPALLSLRCDIRRDNVMLFERHESCTSPAWSLLTVPQGKSPKNSPTAPDASEPGDSAGLVDNTACSLTFEKKAEVRFQMEAARCSLLSLMNHYCRPLVRLSWEAEASVPEQAGILWAVFCSIWLSCLIKPWQGQRGFAKQPPTSWHGCSSITAPGQISCDVRNLH